eukprot:gene5369-6700_t
MVVSSIKYFSLVVLLFLNVFIISVKSEPYNPSCSWWVSNVENQGNKNDCNFANPCDTLMKAIDQMSNAGSSICPETTTRYIFIVSSDKAYIGEGNVGIRVNPKYPDLDARFYSVLIQAVDPITTEPTTDLPKMANTPAVFDAESKSHLMLFDSVSPSILFQMITFKNGIHKKDAKYDSSITVALQTRSISFDNCQFTNNTGGKLGSIYWAPTDKTTISNCIFSNNTASLVDGYGGAIRFSTRSNVLISNCNFSNNSAYTGGAMYSNSSDVVVKSTSFIGNTATYAGGAVYNQHSPRFVDQSWNFLTFKNNKAQFGGALMDYVTTILYNNVSFIQNEATIAGGAALFNDSISSFTNIIFESNKANQGGAVWVFDPEPNNSQLLIKNSKFTSNTATIGGAIYCNSSTARMNTENEFIDNIATDSDSKSNDDFCTKTCLTAAGDCGCPGGCTLPPPPVKVITSRRETKIAIAIFLPVTAVLLGVVGFLLWKTNQKGKIVALRKNNFDDQIRLNDQRDEGDL